MISFEQFTRTVKEGPRHGRRYTARDLITLIVLSKEYKL